MIRDRVRERLVGLFVRYGLIKHPYGRDYARENYSRLGRFQNEHE